MNTFDKIVSILMGALGAAVGFFAGVPPLALVLLGVMTLDYVSGMFCGWAGVSNKSAGGGLSSTAAVKGLVKKIMILCLVVLAVMIDYAIGSTANVTFTATTGVVCLWFIASEGLSILENAAELGLPVPETLKSALEVMKGAGNKKD